MKLKNKELKCKTFQNIQVSKTYNHVVGQVGLEVGHSGKKSWLGFIGFHIDPCIIQTLK